MQKKIKITQKKKTLNCKSGDVKVWRNEEGLIHIDAPNFESYIETLGFCHAYDRFIQMDITRIAAQGRLCECLSDSEDSFEIDCFMRDLGISHYAEDELVELEKKDPQTFSMLVNYAAGINLYLDLYGYPWELKLTSRKLEKWEPKDTIMTMKLVGYIGLGQTQQEMQKFIIQTIKEKPDSVEYLKSIFNPHLNELSTQHIEAIENLNLARPSLDKSCTKFQSIFEKIKNLGIIPSLKNSNNWVISSKISHSDMPMMASDPHLEVNRLPCVWYEVNAKTERNHFFGITIPGIPGIIMGRNKDLLFSFTYGFMDLVDFFIEKIANGEVLEHSNTKTPIQIREEVILRKKNPDFNLKVFESTRGVIEYNDENLNNEKEFLNDGLYLSRSWAHHKSGTMGSLKAIRELHYHSNAKDAATIAAECELSCNWLFADRRDNIVYQQSGSLPKRHSSGLIPHLPYLYKCNWNGFIPPEKLLRTENPESGFIATANQKLNSKETVAVNLSMADYRYDRIKMLLSSLSSATEDDFIKIQTDILSLQAKKYSKKMGHIFLKDSHLTSMAQWDFRFSKNTKAPTFFKRFHQNLIFKIFSPVFGKELFTHFLYNTSLFADYYGLFDRIALAQEDMTEEEKELWFSKNTQVDFFKIAIKETIESLESAPLTNWGEENKLTMKHILLGDQWPFKKWYNIGPIEIEGDASTVSQGNLYNTKYGKSSFCPSWRFISDLSQSRMISVLAGGVTQRPGRLYKIDMARWQNHQYKAVNFSDLS